MPVLNENGLLPQFMRPPGVEARPRSLAQMIDVLRRIPSPAFPVPPGVCGPAPSFRAAINDIYDSIVGLTLYEISGKSHGWALSKHQMHEPQPATERLAVRDQAYTAAGGLPDHVRLCILDQLDSVDDPKAAARTNKGIYQIYQGHKVFLARKFLRRDQSHSSSGRELAGNVDEVKVLEPVSSQTKGEGPAIRANLDTMILRSDDDSDVSKSRSASEAESRYDISNYDSISTPQAHGRPPAYPPSYAESTEAPMADEEAARILWPNPYIQVRRRGSWASMRISALTTHASLRVSKKRGLSPWTKRSSAPNMTDLEPSTETRRERGQSMSCPGRHGHPLADSRRAPGYSEPVAKAAIAFARIYTRLTVW